MRILIVGRGNIGLALGVLIGSKPEFVVTLWSRSIVTRRTVTAKAYVEGSLAVVGKIHEEVYLEQACLAADVVIITTPTHVSASLAIPISCFARDSKLIIFWEGTGVSLRNFVLSWTGSTTIVGLQRSPLIASRQGKTRNVEISGIRSHTVASTNLGGLPERAKSILEALFPCRFDMAVNYDCVTLSTSNPLIHPARLFSFAHSAFVPSARDTFVYSGWDDAASELLLNLHEEVYHLRSALNLPAVQCPTLLDSYPRLTVKKLTKELAATSGLARIRLPAAYSKGKRIFDFAHRYFLEDINEGLRAISNLAEQTSMKAIEVNRIIQWYERSS